MIEDLNKNLVNCSVKVGDNSSVFTHTFKIPFKDGRSELQIIVPSGHSYFDKVIGSYREFIIAALKARMEACVDMVSRNLFNVIHSDEQSITFKKSNGSIHTFNHGSFKAMQFAIESLEAKRYDELSKHQLIQILKALYWVEKPKSDIKGISFGDLISCIMDKSSSMQIF